MKNKCTVIQINGFRGLLLVGFIITCAIVGFVVFPSWCCQHLWNYIAGYVSNMPLMELKHGAMVWLILILVAYVTMYDQLKVSFLSAKEDSFERGPFDNLDDFEPINELDEMEIVNKIKNDIIEQVEKEKMEK